MEEFLQYILKSTIALSLFYLAYRLFLKNYTFFRLNRIVLVSILLVATVFPLIHLPQSLLPESSLKVTPTLLINQLSLEQAPSKADYTVASVSPTGEIRENTLLHALVIVYFAGLIVSILFFTANIVSLLKLIIMNKVYRRNGFKIVLVKDQIPAFSFGKLIFISRYDFQYNGTEIISHEQAHIQMNHYIDLWLIEIVKMIQWFNPFVYLLKRELKDIHEFQADRAAINKGLDVTKYQLLILKKSVGQKAFMLANHFNQSQTKKRIRMMNKVTNRKNMDWKAIAFFPVFMMLLILFGFSYRIDNVLDTSSLKSLTVNQPAKHWSIGDFLKPPKGEFYDMDLKKSLTILMNFRSDLMVNYKKPYLSFADVDKIEEYVKKYRDYESANDETKAYFQAILINEKTMMKGTAAIYVQRDKCGSDADYDKLLNIIGNSILKTRDKYSKSMFKADYATLTPEMQSTIDGLIPLNVYIVEDRYIMCSK